MAWFAAATVTVGILLQNPFALVAALLAFIYLGVRAVRFKQLITTLETKLSVRVIPVHTYSLVAEDFKLGAVITNSHSTPVKIVATHPKSPSEMQIRKAEVDLYFLPSQADLHADVTIRSMSPGQFAITKWIVVLEDAGALLTHNMVASCSAYVEIAPVLGKVESKLQIGSLANITRFGTGTDLARIREVVSQDDFHSIDWKSTARTGKFMKKEYYPETEPAILTLVDASVLARWPQVLVQLGKLFVTFLSSTPLGVILYNDQRVIDQLQPSTGTESRLQILRLLLTGSAAVGLDDSIRNGMRLHQELAELIRLLHTTSRDITSRRVDAFAQSLLPYYESDLFTYSTDLKRQGAYRALESVFNTSPMLIIVVADYNRDVRGLCEGAIVANTSGHRVILVVVGTTRDSLPPEVLGLQEAGIQVRQIGSADLANAIRQAIADIPAMRVRNPRQVQYVGR